MTLTIPVKSRSEYVDSIVQEDMTRCYLCGRRDRKLDRHEIFPGAYRSKSKSLGLWVLLCHSDCHEGNNGVHRNAELSRRLRQDAERKALEHYGWFVKDFIREFGKNYLD